jgi:deoxyribonuclease-1
MAARADKCAYKKLKDVVEPRRSVWGDIARSLFYMHVEYGLPLQTMLPVLKVWHRADPPKPARAVAQQAHL